MSTQPHSEQDSKPFNLAAWLGNFFLFVFGVLAAGYVVSVGWAWFVVPLGAPALGLARTVGLCYLARYVVGVNQPEKKRSNVQRSLETVVIAAGSLGVMWVIKQFV